MVPQIAADLRLIRAHRIYFYHHSVGVNVLSGVERLEAEAGGERIAMAWVENGTPRGGGALVHGGGGRNGDPKSKIDFFAEKIRSDPDLRPDLALMKLCYVDFTPSTDVEDLVAHYRRTLEELERARPEVRFAHVTVPLMRRPNDLKSSLRRLVGSEVWEDAANAKRAAYNRRLKEIFASEPIFDLAGIEAAGPGGPPPTAGRDATRDPALHPAFTDDGGHLNDAGRRAAGSAAIRFFAEALRSRPAAAATR